MRSYYHPRPTSQPALPCPQVGAQAAPAPRKRRKGYVLFAVTLGLIVLLSAILGALTLGRMLAQWTAEGDWQLPQPTYSSQDRPDSWTAPSIALAEHGDGTTLTLVSAQGKQELSLQENYQRNIASIVGIYSDTGTG